MISKCLYEASITLVSKPDKHIKINQTYVFHDMQNISKISSSTKIYMYMKNKQVGFFRYVPLFQIEPADCNGLIPTIPIHIAWHT